MSKTEDNELTGDERRCHARYVIKGAIVEYVKVEFLALVDKAMRERGPLDNVSEGGMLFLSRDPFTVGQSLSLCLEVSPGDDCLRMRGTVVRAQTGQGKEHHRIGVKFTMCSAEAAKVLGRLPDECAKTPDRVLLYVKNE